MGLYDYREFIANEAACIELLRDIRWPEGIECPKCGYKKLWKLGSADDFKYKCSENAVINLRRPLEPYLKSPERLFPSGYAP